MRYFIIYKVTNCITDEYYIGMHSTVDLNDGYLGSGTRIKESVSEYGAKNHTFEILEFCDNREQLRIREKEIVNNELLSDPLCINLRVGGKGGFTSEQQRLNNLKSVERQRWLAENDEEWRDHRSERATRHFERLRREGKIPPPKGHIKGEFNHTDDTRKKISKILKGKGRGCHNSQYGTVVISHYAPGHDLPTVTKRIKVNEEEYWLNRGWKKGAKKRKQCANCDKMFIPNFSGSKQKFCSKHERGRCRNW